MWVPITGYAYNYRINEDAIVQRQLGDGSWKTLHVNVYKGNKCRRRYAVVAMTLKKYTYKKVALNKLMVDAFMGGYAAHPGKRIMHRDESLLNCGLSNLYWATPSHIGHLTGGRNRKSVEKVDKDGNVVELFKSIAECAKHEHVSKSHMRKLLSGEFVPKDKFRMTGYTYRFEVGA